MSAHGEAGAFGSRATRALTARLEAPLLPSLMKTEISKFCESALQAVEPLPEALNDAASALEQTSEKELVQESLATLNDVRARLRSLVDKLSHQQAYLLIFGPLKSGKSTLMNAISGSYVSEVTSLPGYPCLVYVRHGETPHFSATRYNGRETVFADGVVLKDMIDDSHIALATQIRETERRGESFEPGRHFSEAIRRIDIRVPVPSLAESSTVLVDTPGLYSRMNFGYDVLTREFRDSAACAVFVVKTDNLFLEQVFEEFNQLLDLFSRIFLVVNVDTGKRDLQPDGTLKPSAESRNPEQIIEAFKTLSMAGPLRQAYEEGRVRLHAVDLLNAASAYLTKDPEAVSAAGTNEKASFEAFLHDLTDYLNSSDYTRAFISDSLRQGYTFCEEAKAVATSEVFVQLKARQDELSEQLSSLNERIDTVDRLLKVDWSATFDRVRQDNGDRFEQSVTAKSAQAIKELHSALERWYETTEGLKSLEQRHWNPLLREVGQALADETRQRVRRLVETPLGGSEPAALVMTDLHAVDFELSGPAQAALPSIQIQDATEPYTTVISPEVIPVKKTLGDWFLFRGIATVRRRLFGEDLSKDIAPEEKQLRLPENCREALRESASDAVKAKVPSLPKTYSDRVLAAYTEKFCAEVLKGLRGLREELATERADREAPFKANADLLATMEALVGRVGAVAEELNSLAQKEGLPPLFTPSLATTLPEPEEQVTVGAVEPEPSAA